MERISVLFVCLGNICRSPLAEAVFRHIVREAGLEHAILVDSAGTESYHVGEPPDRRTRAVAARRGVEVNGRARQLTEDDLLRFDYVIAVDRANFEVVRRIAGRVQGAAATHLLREFDVEPDEPDVPDPYYGGPAGFERVHDIVERSCRQLFQHLLSKHGLAPLSP